MKKSAKQLIAETEAKALAHAPVDNIRYWVMFAALLEVELILMEIGGMQEGQPIPGIDPWVSLKGITHAHKRHGSL